MHPGSASAPLRGRKPRKQAAEMKMTISPRRAIFRPLNLAYLISVAFSFVSPLSTCRQTNSRSEPL